MGVKPLNETADRKNCHFSTFFWRELVKCDSKFDELHIFFTFAFRSGPGVILSVRGC